MMPVDRDTPIDHAAALRRTEGDVELLAELARIFLDEYPRLLGKVRAAVASGTPRRIEHAAHELKGCLGNLAANGGFAAAERLEILGRSGELTDAPAVAALLEAELARLAPALERLITPGA